MKILAGKAKDAATAREKAEQAIEKDEEKEDESNKDESSGEEDASEK